MSITAKWRFPKTKGQITEWIKKHDSAIRCVKGTHLEYYIIDKLKVKEVRDISRKSVLKESMRDYINIR